MKVKLITAPTIEPVTLAELKTHLRLDSGSTEDSLLTAIIQAARERVEDITRRALLTQTWELYLDNFPSVNYIELPFGNLQSVNSFKYTDSDSVEHTLIENTDYLVELNGEGIGRVVLVYNGSWPTATLNTSNPIVIEFDCGWEAAADVPSKIKSAIMLFCGDLYENRESQTLKNLSSEAFCENRTANLLLASARLHNVF